ncbi:MAG: hypothetical protein ACLUQ0_03325 [Enterococcus italicus]|uniref:hypothetical protein n=1 Tax=Enterococcus italicus TaxID=246144 RepID=UPI0039941053
MSIDKSKDVLKNYHSKFSEKIYSEENNDTDLLMNIFNITPELKRENRQYWGRELGACWEKIVSNLFEQNCEEYGPAVKFGKDEPYDFSIGDIVVDTKYRVGSGDSGTLKKFKNYGEQLIKLKKQPVFLILRDDNLNGAITAIKNGGWKVYTGEESFEFIKNHTGVDFKQYLKKLDHTMDIKRNID